MNKNWSCIVITCPNLSSVIATEKEIEFLKKKNRIPESETILVIEDPAKNLGSGAATLNALLVAAEYLSAKRNYMVLSSDVLFDAHILILHNGRDYLYSSSGKAFISLPLEYTPDDKSKPYASGIFSNLEVTLQLIEKLSKESPYGVWVCSTDMTILHAESSVSWKNASDVVMFCIPSDCKYATGHGVVSIDEEGYIADICYCGSTEQINTLKQGDGKVPLVSGIVFLNTKVAESLLSLHVQSPLDSCTYLGLDSGIKPLQVSLFFDILVALSTKIDKSAFISGKCGKTYNQKFGIQSKFSNECLMARCQVWEELSSYKMSPNILFGAEHYYWSEQQSAEHHTKKLFQIASFPEIHSVCQVNNKNVSLSECLAVNSTIKANICQVATNAVVTDSYLEANHLIIGENAFLSGVVFTEKDSDLCIPSNLVINCFHQNFILMFGKREEPYASIDLSEGTFCNIKWSKAFNILNITESDVWDSNLSSPERNLMNARLFSNCLSLKEVICLFQDQSSNQDFIATLQKWKSSPLYTLEEILNTIEYEKVFNHKRYMCSKVSSTIVEHTLCENLDLHILPYFQASCADQWFESLVETLDDILLSNTNSIIKTRTLSCIADLLSCKAGIIGGLRSGPGSNCIWSNAFALLLNGETEKGLKELSQSRSQWLFRPDHLIRASRHYERAAQILIQNSVKTAKKYMILTSTSMPAIGSWVSAECPARIDLQGGWSDTPPICYELGGSVVNVAILVDGKKPIGARACRIAEPHILLKIMLKEASQDLVINDVKDILNYNQPNAKGALLKAALICTDVVDTTSELTLEEQLMKKFGGGIEVQSWSLLPQGCGMGTSSILAGAIVSVLWTVTGKAFDKTAIVHAVLYVEQLLTTGGGWQDQVSGIMGGINRGYSESSLPLHVKVEPLDVSEAIVKELNSHLLLIYTGKVRLAKNLLQNVIRNWYAREENVVKCFKDLILHSFEMKSALLKGDFREVGRLMNTYWEQKKVLAPGCEPESIKEIMAILRPHCHGQLLVGAGGGGFMCVLTKHQNAKESITLALHAYKESQKLSVHTVTIHMEGLEIKWSKELKK
ncbi:hypothetical protein JTE90_015082 [Oedothorax gibbosus]|uniref:L-fucose kinase n=1 Tax=Oedothorax gibbosus TaxID=931172 RepID=A0AAV6VPY2_9ARAC|nr:hypothetical protein JTE90_015082 [Oedothorax gibbosus]